MGHCLFMRKGETHTAPAKSFAGTSWADIITACQTNTVPETWLVGDQKSMTINGTDYLIDIIGKNHDTYADGSGTAPLTFQLHDCYETLYRMHNSKVSDIGYGKTTMRNTTLPSILELMPDDVKVSIKNVNKLCATSNYTGTIVTTSEKLFLLSEIEVYGSLYRGWEGEGTQYDYYKAGNPKRKKYLGSDSFAENILRSPYKYTSDSHYDYSYFAEVFTTDTNEIQANAAPAYSMKSITFAFCF